MLVHLSFGVYEQLDKKRWRKWFFMILRLLICSGTPETYERESKARVCRSVNPSGFFDVPVPLVSDFREREPTSRRLKRQRILGITANDSLVSLTPSRCLVLFLLLFVPSEFCRILILWDHGSYTKAYRVVGLQACYESWWKLAPGHRQAWLPSFGLEWEIT
jgi:hypothetical protein